MYAFPLWWPLGILVVVILLVILVVFMVMDRRE
jgi:hypothetical protein